MSKLAFKKDLGQDQWSSMREHEMDDMQNALELKRLGGLERQHILTLLNLSRLLEKGGEENLSRAKEIIKNYLDKYL